MKVHAPEFPSEPPHRSVVIDEQGLAWQRRADRWVAAAADVSGDCGRTWPNLLLTRGTLDIVHVPPAPPGDDDAPDQCPPAA